MSAPAKKPERAAPSPNFIAAGNAGLLGRIQEAADRHQQAPFPHAYPTWIGGAVHLNAVPNAVSYTAANLDFAKLLHH